MTAVPKLPPRLTPDEYLAIERKAEFKSEYLNGEMFAMAGASFAHTRIKDNLARLLNNQLDGGPCVATTSDLRVKVSATGLYTYPDVVIVCGPPEFEDSQVDTLVNPRVIIEVLSDSTAEYDRGTKYRHYQRIDSLQEYILVSQKEPAIEQLIRQPNGRWESATPAGLDSGLELVSMPARVRLADIYAGVTFPEPPKPPAGRPR
jgi:Uma2 family endonuclease